MRICSLALPALGLLALLVAAPARAGDPDVARLLFEKAEKASRSRDFEEAASYYRRALEEHAPFPDAAFGLGESLEKLGKTREAIDAYLLCKDQVAAMENPGRAETRLRERAEKAVRKLGAGYAELAEIDEAFVKDCLGFGRRFFNSEPGWAKRALEHANRLQPGNRLVEGYLERLAEAKGPATAAGVFEPLVKDDTLAGWDPGATEDWSCTGGTIAAHPTSSGGHANFAKTFIDGTFSLSGRIRLLEKTGSKPVFGFMFGRKPGTVTHAFLLIAYGNEIAISRFGGEGSDDLRTKVLLRFDAKQWHEFRIDVSPGKVAGFVDGKEMVSYAADARDQFDGPVGLFVQDARIEVKDMGVRK